MLLYAYLIENNLQMVDFNFLAELFLSEKNVYSNSKPFDKDCVNVYFQ